jgi:hypothetical protein
VIWVIFHFGCLFWAGWHIAGFFSNGVGGRLERTVLAYLLGSGCLSFAGFLLGAAGLPVTRIYLGATYLAISLILPVVNRNRREPAGIGLSSPGRSQPLARAMILVLGLIILFSVAINIWYPVFTDDGLSCWALKGRAIAITGQLEAIRFGAQPFYPLHLPLSLTPLYLYSEKIAKIPISLNYISLIVIFYISLRKSLSKESALLFTVLLASLPYLFEHSRRVYADLTCALYYTSGTLYLFRYFREGSRSRLILSGLLCALAVWTKPEGWFLTAANTIVLSLFLLRRRKAGLIIVFLFPVIFVGGSWGLYSYLVMGHSNSFVAMFQDAAGGIIRGDLCWSKLGTILQYSGMMLLFRRSWEWLIPLFLLVVFLRWRSFQYSGYLFAVIALNFATLIFVFYSIPENYMRMMRQTVEREYMHFFPVLVFYIGLAAGPVIDGGLKRLRESGAASSQFSP